MLCLGGSGFECGMVVKLVCVDTDNSIGVCKIALTAGRLFTNPLEGDCVRHLIFCDQVPQKVAWRDFSTNRTVHSSDEIC